MNKLLKTIRHLRSKNGCPWDRKQTLKTLRRCLIEEAYEVVDAIDRGNSPALQEELGDVLCVILMMSELSAEKNHFNFNKLARSLRRKLIRRHPHVFGSKKVSTAEEALDTWTRKKIEEKSGDKVRYSTLGIHRPHGPALIIADKLGKRAARAGFDWRKAKDVLDKVREECNELEQHLNTRNKHDVEEELGDLLFATAQLGRKLKVEPEWALRKACKKFQKRFDLMAGKAAIENRLLKELNPQELEELWEDVKRDLSRK